MMDVYPPLRDICILFNLETVVRNCPMFEESLRGVRLSKKLEIFLNDYYNYEILLSYDVMSDADLKGC